MAIDRYHPCPCGSGNKIKFCCCKDLLAELEKIQRMLEGEQRTACLEYINEVLKNHPDRAALLCAKAMLETQLDHKEDADQTIAALLARFPDNPVGYAEQAIAAGVRGEAEAAVESLQAALERISKDYLPLRVYEAIGLVGEVLIRRGYVYAGRAHLLFQAGIGGSRDTRAISLLMQLNRANDLPLMLKDDPDFIEPQPGVPWTKAAEQAMEDATRAHWRKAADAFRRITVEHPAAADAWRNLGTLEGVLARWQPAVEALRAYSQLDVPFDDAVEAIAQARLFDRETEDASVDMVELTVEIKDLDKLIETFSSNKRVSVMTLDPSMFPSEDGPPPRMGVWLLDKPLPVSGAELTLEQAPNILAELQVFGRRTDREPHLKAHVLAGSDSVNARAALQEIAGELLDLPGESEVVGKLPESQVAMGWNWRLPDDTPRQLRNRLVAEQRREVILNRWTNVASPGLAGKSPAEAAGDPQLAIPLAAEVLMLELSTIQGGHAFDFSELREHLQMRQPEPIDPTDLDINDVSLPRLSRIVADKLTDEQLVAAFRRAASTMALEALRNFTGELIRRESVDAELKADGCGMMAHIEQDSTAAVGWLEQAKQFAQAAGTSPAEYLLTEIQVRLARRELAEAETALRTLQNNHLNEPGVAQALYSMMAELGLIAPDGRPAGMPPGVQPGARLAAAQPAENAASSGLWTPGGDQPAREAKKIWTPD